MKRFILASLVAAASVLSLVGTGAADNEIPVAGTESALAPVVAQLALRDRTLIITAAPTGYRYTVADAAGAVLSAGLTEEQLAEQHPELAETLRPAVADEFSSEFSDEFSELMMLAPAL